jgi:hypothetical protein
LDAHINNNNKLFYLYNIFFQSRMIFLPLKAE